MRVSYVWRPAARLLTIFATLAMWERGEIVPTTATRP